MGRTNHLREEGKIINSPWNIAASFNADMSFNCEEISTMLHDYETDRKTGMDVFAVANEIYSPTVEGEEHRHGDKLLLDTLRSVTSINR